MNQSRGEQRGATGGWRIVSDAAAELDEVLSHLLKSLDLKTGKLMELCSERSRMPRWQHQGSRGFFEKARGDSKVEIRRWHDLTS